MQVSRFQIIVAVVVTVIVLAITNATAQQQNPRQLFERARMLEEGNHNLTEAIKLYNQVIKQAQEQRALAAKAQLRVGLLYERLGRKAEAQRAFQALVSQYADQTDVARQAQARLLRRVNPVASTASLNSVTVRRIWAAPDFSHDVSSSSVSPDGRYLVFTDWGMGDLAVRDLVTGQDRHLTKNTRDSRAGADVAVCSPDSKRIAYAWWWHTKDERVAMDLCLIGVDGAGQRVLYRNPEVWNVEPYGWSPDGKSILVAIALEKTFSAFQIAWVSSEDGSVRLVKTVSSQGSGLRLSLSPDGRYIAYTMRARKDSPQRDIFIITSDGSDELPLVQSPADDYQLGWAPDGKSLLLASDRSKTIDAWLISVVDGKPQRLPELVKRDLGMIWPIGFTQNGTFYYGLANNSKNNIYTATLSPETGELSGPPILAGTRFIGSNSAPDWSPDGRYLSYESQWWRKEGETAEDKLFILNLETGEERELRTKLRRFNAPRWFSDGKSLLVRDLAGLAGLFKIDAGTGDTSLLFPEKPGSELFVPRLSGDGKSVFYQSKRSLWARNLESGIEKELYHAAQPGGSKTDARELRPFTDSVALSQDGRTVAFTLEKSLIVSPTLGGMPRELLRLNDSESFAGPPDSVAWMPDGRYLLFAKVRDKQIELWRIPAEGGESQRLGPFMIRDLLNVRDLRIHPDGRRIAFTAVQNPDHKVEVWAMENFLPAAQPRKTAVSRP